MIKVKKLKSGITVCYDQLPEMDSAAIGIWVRTGAVNEEAKYAGISHLIEHMMFKGTEKRSALKIAEDVDRLGGQINAFTGKEATCYYIKSLSDQIGEAFDIVLDMFTGSVFDKEEMKREKMVIEEEMKMVSDMPDEDAMDTIGELIFKGLPSANSIIGAPASLKRISRDTVLKYIDEQYTKDSIVISVAGRFDERMISRKIEKNLGHLRARKKAVKYPAVKYEPAFKVKVKDIEQSHLCMATRSIKMTDERYTAFQILNNIMGGSMSSRLFQNVREQKGLAYSVFSSNSAMTKMGFYNIYAGVSHDKIGDAIDAIKEELYELKKTPVDTAEIDKAKQQIKSNYIFGQESVNSRMFVNGKNVLLKGYADAPSEIIKSVDAVTPEQIERVKRLITDPAKYSAVLITNKKRDLKKMIRG